MNWLFFDVHKLVNTVTIYNLLITEVENITK